MKYINLGKIMNYNVKVIVFCIVVIASVSNNGKASLNDLKFSSEMLLEDTTKFSDKSCYRPCKFNVKPRRCYFNFNVEPMVTDESLNIAINGMVPGPAIHVCMNDIVIVKVTNKIPDQDLSIHWHGIDQSGTPYMDGVPMITQCPINYRSTFKYAFRASNPGTYFYHAHSEEHHTDGVFGALVVNQPTPLDANSPFYDYDRSKENTLVISSKFSKMFTGSLEDLTKEKPSNININGQVDSYKILVNEGYAYRLRIINAAVSCPFKVYVSDLELLVIASDGQPVKPVSGSNLILYPGERMDVVVKTDKKFQAYWLHVDGEGQCEGLSSKAMLVHSGFNYTSMLSNDKLPQINGLITDTISGYHLKSIKEMPHKVEVQKVFLEIKRNVVKFKDTDNDFRYISDAIAKKPFYPAQLTLRENGVVQINGKSFLYPNAPLLTQYKDIKKDAICELGTENKDTQCVLTVTAPLNSVLEFILINADEHEDDPYTFHLHGYSAQVLATQTLVEGHAVMNLDTFKKLDRNGLVTRNILNPPLKDTVVVPNKGFTVTRVTLDHAGAWLLECRSCSLASLPTALVVNVPQTLPKSITDSLPKCGNYRPPDVLLN